MIYSSFFLPYMVELEGKIPYVYKDNAGYKTVGIGCRVYSDAYDKYSKTNPMPDNLINELFWIRAKQFIEAVQKSIKVPLKDYQFDALIALAFNIGADGFSKSTLVKKINAGATFEELKPQFDAWRLSTNQKTGEKFINPTLVTRRKMEYILFTTGQYLGYDLKPILFSKKKY